MRIVKRVLAGVCVVVLGATFGGCANDYRNFYTPVVSAARGDFVPPASGTLPRVMTGRDPRSDRRHMQESGYTLIGFSRFIAPDTPSVGKDKALTQAESVHASVVILYSRYHDTQQKVMPVMSPQYGDDYGRYGSYGGYAPPVMNLVPVTVSRYLFLATYWVRVPYVLGAAVKDLTPSEHRMIGSNKGVKVVDVVTKSPAFYADLFQGDILTSVNGRPIYEASDFRALMNRYRGQKVDLHFLRGDRRMSRQILLASGEPGRESSAGGPFVEGPDRPSTALDRWAQTLAHHPVGVSHRKWVAIIVGVEQYQSPRVADAVFADNDARTVARVFRGLGWTTIALSGPDTSYSSLKSRIRAFKGSRLDRFLVYFSGHGTVSGDGHPALATFDVLPSGVGAIPLSTLKGWMESVPSHSRYLLVDACFVGGSRAFVPSGVRPLVPVRVPSGHEPHHLLEMAASSRSQESHVDRKEHHGLFTEAFLRGVRAGLPDPTWRSVSDRLQRDVPFWASVRGFHQEPFISPRNSGLLSDLLN